MAASQVVMITGCSKGGLGHALAIAFARAGCTVVATDLTIASMDDLGAAHPNIQTLLQFDVTSADSRAAAVTAVLAKHGRIDVLVNNAGILRAGPMAELPISELHHSFATNFFAPVELIQAVVPQMIARRSGKIVNVGSVLGFMSAPFAGAYCATKSALHAVSDSLRVELKPFGIDVITFAPGSIKSNLVHSCLQYQEKVVKWNIYAPWNTLINNTALLVMTRRATTPQEFATKAVKEVLKRNPTSYFIKGHLSTVAIIASYLPMCIKDFIFAQICGLNKDLTLSYHKNLNKKLE